MKSRYNPDNMIPPVMLTLSKIDPNKWEHTPKGIQLEEDLIRMGCIGLYEKPGSCGRDVQLRSSYLPGHPGASTALILRHGPKNYGVMCILLQKRRNGSPLSTRSCRISTYQAPTMSECYSSEKLSHHEFLESF